MYNVINKTERRDENIDLITPLYAPDLEKFRRWMPPLAEQVTRAQ